MINVFVVGFPRSGTTLAQSVIADKFGLATFPETHYFFDKYCCPLDKTILDPVISDFIHMPRLLKKRSSGNVIPEGGDFLDIMNNTAQLQGRVGWLEKTPGHVRRIPVIEKKCQNAKFIHIFRRFSPILESWGKAGSDAEIFQRNSVAIQRQWRRDILRTIYFCRGENHMAIPYEGIVNEFSQFLHCTSKFLEVKFNSADKMIDSMLAKTVISSHEKWKVNNGSSQILNAKVSDTLVGCGLNEELYQKVKSISGF